MELGSIQDIQKATAPIMAKHGRLRVYCTTPDSSCRNPELRAVRSGDGRVVLPPRVGTDCAPESVGRKS